MLRTSIAACVISCCALIAPAVQSQERFEAETRDLLVGKTVRLRHFYSEDKQRFNSTGKVKSSTDECPWTECSTFEVERVDFKRDTIEIKGRRVFATFPMGKLQYRKASEKLVVAIELAPEPNRTEQLRTALQQILLKPGEEWTSLLPPLWRDYMEGKKLSLPEKSPDGSPVKTPYAESVAYRLGNGLKPPKAIYKPDPPFTNAARNYQVQGSIQFQCIIGTDGKLHDLKVIRPLGFGLEEQSAEVLNSWRFKPGEKNGEPVAIVVEVEINFHLY